MKQTAVEWLTQQVKSKEWQDMFIWHKEEVFEQAKAMEKEQMVNFAEFVATYPDKNININGEMETYSTLCFKTQKQAIKNQNEINSYFNSRVINSEIVKGVDERGVKGFYVKYRLLK
jgi:hypothetical protein